MNLKIGHTVSMSRHMSYLGTKLTLVSSDPLDVLMPPTKTLPLSEDDISALSRFLQTQTRSSRRICRSVLPNALVFYGKVRVDCDGDTIHAREFVRETDLSRDASYVSVSFNICYFTMCLIFYSIHAGIEKAVRLKHGASCAGLRSSTFPIFRHQPWAFPRVDRSSSHSFVE
jgi:hypothetical protein